MKIHLNQIPPEGLHLTGDEDCPIGELAEQDIRCIGPLHYNLDLGISDGALWVDGAITQKVELQCVACLEKFEHVISVPAFALHTELHGPEAIDITPFIREDILLNLPPHPHCDRDGGRVCKRSKVQVASDISESSASAGKREHDWGELDKLKPRLKGKKN